MHRSRDTAHARRFAMHSYRIPIGDVMSHNSRREKRRIFKHSGVLDHVTGYRRSLNEVKRSKVKVTSQGHKTENGLMVKLSPVNDP